MKLYKAKEIAEILQVHVKTVYKWGRAGQLKTVKVGKSVRFFLPELDELDSTQNTDNTIQGV